MVKSEVYQFDAWHSRLAPVEHSFSYPLWMMGIDLAELDQLDQEIELFGHNRFSVFSIFDNQYIDSSQKTLLEKIRSFVEKEGARPVPARVVLLTVPRLFGYVFNPVSFYLCYDSGQKLQDIVCEVHNTFGEAELYLAEIVDQKGGLSQPFAKSLYVSPFFDCKGQYQLCVQTAGGELKITVNLYKDDELVFCAGISGRGRQVTRWTLLKQLWPNPLFAWMTMPRIHWQAMKLYFQRRLPVYQKKSAFAACPLHSGWMKVIERLRLMILAKGRTVKEA